jgi:hypothetical protein
MMMGMDQSETLSSKLDHIYYTLFLQVHSAADPPFTSHDMLSQNPFS